MGVAAERLEARVAAANLLKRFDAEARRMGLQRMSGRPGSERKRIVEMLRTLGGESWPYSPSGDKSWLP